jgi:Leucine-rich repeat (LRR) protein
VLDLAENKIAVLPSEVVQMSRLKKLYLDRNQLTRLPHELYKLSQTLALLGIAENPLEDELMQLYYAGLPVLLAHLKATRCTPPRAPPSSAP